MDWGAEGCGGQSSERCREGGGRRAGAKGGVEPGMRRRGGEEEGERGCAVPFFLSLSHLLTYSRVLASRQLTAASD